MIVWRLCRRLHADLTGEGARRYGGRWNSAGLPAVYLAEHPALAALEVRVHLDLPFDLLPVDFTLMRVITPNRPNTLYTTPEDTLPSAMPGWPRPRRQPSTCPRSSCRTPEISCSIPAIPTPRKWKS